MSIGLNNLLNMLQQQQQGQSVPAYQQRQDLLLQQQQAPSSSYVNPNAFMSGPNYARLIAGGENVEQMIAPGVSYSPEQPMGYNAAGSIMQPQPPQEDSGSGVGGGAGGGVGIIGGDTGGSDTGGSGGGGTGVPGSGGLGSNQIEMVRNMDRKELEGLFDFMMES